MGEELGCGGGIFKTGNVSGFKKSYKHLKNLHWADTVVL